MVITIATPNSGSGFDRSGYNLAMSLCRLGIAEGLGPTCLGALSGLDRVLTALPALKTGSKELRALPDWPRSLPVYAIAGNIRPHYNLFVRQWDGAPSKSDTLVTTSSALHSVGAEGLGGTKEFICPGGPPPVLPGWTHGDCEHGALLNDQSVQQAVVVQIRAYLAAHPLRKLPETCSQTALYQGPGYTLQARATVLSGTVTCNAAVQLAQDYLEKSGPESTTVVDKWTCRATSSGPNGFIAECTSPEGKVRLNGE